MNPSYAAKFKSRSQMARSVTEKWAADNLYCVACESDRVACHPPNTEAVDFTCKECSAAYQLKAMRVWNERRIPDAGYNAMMRALEGDAVPNLLVMQYDTAWLVHKLLVIPSFFFSPAAVQKRKPLGQNARRAGWVGCNILLSEIAAEGKIFVISDGTPISPQIVRERYASIRPLASVHARNRGWTLDVLRMVRQLGRKRFSLQDVYGFEEALSTIYPSNKNVKPKIRQQLQILRDLNFICFAGRGEYELLR